MFQQYTTRYYHSVPTAGGMAETYATYNAKEKLFCHTTYDDATGRTHTRFFDTLKQFVDWHFQSEGWDAYEDYPLEENVKVTLNQVHMTAAAAARGALSPEGLGAWRR